VTVEPSIIETAMQNAVAIQLTQNRTGVKVTYNSIKKVIAPLFPAIGLSIPRYKHIVPILFNKLADMLDITLLNNPSKELADVLMGDFRKHVSLIPLNPKNWVITPVMKCLPSLKGLIYINKNIDGVKGLSLEEVSTGLGMRSGDTLGYFSKYLLN
jgi:hypothetical protein